MALDAARDGSAVNASEVEDRTSVDGLSHAAKILPVEIELNPPTNDQSLGQPRRYSNEISTEETTVIPARHDGQEKLDEATSTSETKGSSLISQIYPGWLWLALTILAFILTVLYAVHPGMLSRVIYTNDSISHAIRTLRILSGVTDILLSITYFITFDRLLLLLLSREDGVKLPIMLALHASTGYLGLATLGLGKGPAEPRVRAIAVGRLLVMALTAILGIVIMSDVSTTPAVDTTRSWKLSNVEGISLFNPARAPLVAPDVDRIFGSSMSNFLDNNEVAVDITPDKLRSLSCRELNTDGHLQTCERQVFMPGSMPTGVVTQGDFLDSTIAMVYAVKGYVLRYGRGDPNATWTFDEDLDCRTYGTGSGSVRFCITNSASNEIKARMIKCPIEAVRVMQCLTDDSWYADATQATSTTLRLSYRWADVAYHRANATIAWHKLLDTPEQEAPIRASDLLSVFEDLSIGAQSFLATFQEWSVAADPSTDSLTDTAEDGSDAGDELTALSDIIDLLSDTPNLNDTVSRKGKRQTRAGDMFSGAELFSSLFGAAGVSLPGSNPLFPNIPFAMMQVCQSLADLNPGALPTCTNFLQNFLAIPLYWCDDMLPVRANSGGLDLTDMVSEGPYGADIVDFLAYMGIDDASRRRIEDGMGRTNVAVARLRYEIVVGRPTLIVYVVCIGAILIFCIIALAASSRETMTSTSWPLLDFILRMTVRKETGLFTQEDKLPLLQERTSEQRRQIGLLRVHGGDNVRRERSHNEEIVQC